MVQGRERDFKKDIRFELKWRTKCKHTNDPSHISCFTRELAENLHMRPKEVSRVLHELVKVDQILNHGKTSNGRDVFTFKDPKEINTVKVIKSYKKNLEYLYDICKESAIECSKQPAFSNVEYKPVDDWRIIGKNIGKKPYTDEKGVIHVFPKHTRPTQRTAKINQAGIKKLDLFRTRLRAMLEISEGIINYSFLGKFDKEVEDEISQLHKSTIRKLDELMRLATKGLSYLEREIVKDRIGQSSILYIKKPSGLGISDAHPAICQTLVHINSHSFSIKSLE